MTTITATFDSLFGLFGREMSLAAVSDRLRDDAGIAERRAPVILDPLIAALAPQR